MIGEVIGIKSWGGALRFVRACNRLGKQIFQRVATQLPQRDIMSWHLMNERNYVNVGKKTEIIVPVGHNNA